MADTKAERAQRKTLDDMGETRRAAMRNSARRDAALAMLDADGEVTAAKLDARMSETWVERTDDMIANMVAAKALAAVDFEDSQVAAADEALAGSKARTAKFSDLLDAAKAAESEASKVLADAKSRAATARDLADVAASYGSAGLAPVGMPANVQAGTAAATGKAN
jgi:hypothetical protein